MNPFLLPPRERLSDWKTLRASLSDLSEREQLDRVAAYWAKAPLATFAYDPEQPQTWLSPWEMVSDGEWCRNSVAIGMEFTLRLAGWDPKRLTLIYRKDYDISDLALVLQIDDKYLLNYDYGIVSDIPNTRHENICAWQFVSRGYVAV